MEKQIAIITGATGGLGKEFVRQLIDEANGSFNRFFGAGNRKPHQYT